MPRSWTPAPGRGGRAPCSWIERARGPGRASRFQYGACAGARPSVSFSVRGVRRSPAERLVFGRSALRSPAERVERRWQRGRARAAAPGWTPRVRSRGRRRKERFGWPKLSMHARVSIGDGPRGQQLARVRDRGGGVVRGPRPGPAARPGRGPEAGAGLRRAVDRDPGRAVEPGVSAERKRPRAGACGSTLRGSARARPRTRQRPPGARQPARDHGRDHVAGNGAREGRPAACPEVRSGAWACCRAALVNAGPHTVVIDVRTEQFLPSRAR